MIKTKSNTYGMMMMLSATYFLNEKASVGKREREWARAVLPHSFLKIYDGFYLPLNRDHKPLGIAGRWFIDYGDCKPFCVSELEIDLSTIIHTSYSLFGPGEAPWISPEMFRAYRIRLHEFLRLEHPTRRYMNGHTPI